MSFFITRTMMKGTLMNFKTLLSPTLHDLKYLKMANTKCLTRVNCIIKYQQQKTCFFSSKIDPKLKAAALIDLLPKSSILSKTGMITTGTVLSIAAISNELYVINEETIILASFIGIIWFLMNSNKQKYVNWADNYIHNMQSLLNNARKEHALAIKERINTIEAMKDVVDITKDLFKVSKETVELEAKAFELSQIINVQQEAKAVLESWVRYESALRQREQAYLANTVISKVTKELLQPKIQQQNLDQSMSSLIRTLRNIKKMGLYAYGHQMQTIGDAKYGRLVGVDSYGNKYYENIEETPNRTRWVDYRSPLYDASQYMVDEAPSERTVPNSDNRTESDVSTRPWKKPFQPNLTLSQGAYKPYNTTMPLYTAWIQQTRRK
ncbi:hypothetical protein PCK2_000057 [Pneumocystis canis]|nr:hypothetical protein PCK2_000057 [Pneumocystis canis]